MTQDKPAWFRGPQEQQGRVFNPRSTMDGVNVLGIGGLGTSSSQGVPLGNAPIWPNGLTNEPYVPQPTSEELLNAITRSYDAYLRTSMKTPNYNPDNLLRSKGYPGVYEIATMSIISRVIRLLKYIVLYKPHQTQARVDGQEVQNNHPEYEIANQVSDFCRWVIGNIINPETGNHQDFREVLWYQLDACFIGFSIQELVWRKLDEDEQKIFKKLKNGPLLGLRRIVPRRPEQITFNVDRDTNEVISYNNFTSMGGWQTELHPRKFLHFIFSPEKGLPYGKGLWREMFKHATALSEIIKLLTVSLQKHGGGFLKTTVQNSSPDFMAKVQGILTNAANGAPLIVPEGMMVELLSLPNGVLQPILEALTYHEDTIVKSAIGQNLTTGQGSGSSSYALGGVHKVTQEYFSSYPRQGMEGLITNRLYREIILNNFPRWYLRYLPSHSQGNYDTDELMALSQIHNLYVQNKVLNPAEPFIRKTAGFPPALSTLSVGTDLIIEQQPKVVTNVQ